MSKNIKNGASKSQTKKYQRIAAIESKTKKQRLVLLAIGFSAAALVFAVGCIAVPISELFDVSGILSLLLRLLAIAVFTHLYFLLYESLHAALLRKYCGESVHRVNIGLRLFYCMSKCGLTPKAFFAVKLLPTGIIFAALLLLCILLPSSLFWEVYIILTIDLACAAPYYCTAYILLRSKKKDVLIVETDDAIVISAVE